jgi:hypothetical protein
MRAGAQLIRGVCLLSSGAALAGSVDSGKSAALLAKEVESRIIVKANESVRVDTKGSQLSIEFTNYNVSFLTPFRGSKIMESENADGVVLINSGMTQKVRDRNEESYTRLFLRFDRKTIDHIMMQFQEVIQACET